MSNVRKAGKRQSASPAEPRLFCRLEREGNSKSVEKEISNFTLNNITLYNKITANQKIKNGVKKGYEIYIQLDNAIKEFYGKSKLINLINEDGKLIGLKSVSREEDYEKCVTILQSHPKLCFAYALMDKVRVHTL